MPFSRIKGQERAIEILKESMGLEHLAAAYLFSGFSGIGKKLTAINLAQAVNCLRQKDDACGSCASCLKIEKNQHPDVHIIDNGDTDDIKIEDVRRLKQEIGLRPYEGRVKVFIINNAHNLNADAANAFLKTLEEPPKQSLIVLISDKPAFLLKTIVSRCQVVKFFGLKRDLLYDILVSDYGVEKKRSRYLAYFCEGRLGRALQLKDSDALNEKNRVIDSLAFSGARPWENFSASDRQGLRQALQVLVAWFRDIYLLKSGSSCFELINLDRKEKLAELARGYSFSRLDEIIAAISDTLLYLEQNVNLKLLLSNLNLCLRFN